MNKNESFIEDRIRWRAGQHGIPKASTYYWEADKGPQILFPEKIGKPVLVSSSGESEFIVICTRGAAVKNGVEETSFLYSAVDEILDVKLKADEKKEDLAKLVVMLEGGGKVYVSPERGSPAFCIWNILIMLQRIS